MSDTFFNKQPTISDDENMVYTMGGLDGLPTDAPATPTVPTTQVEQPEAPSYLSRIMPDINFGDFIGSAGQLAQLFPGSQVKPSYQPGLTDLTFTRGYYGPQEDVMPTGFGTESAGTLFWSPQRYQMPAPTFQTQQPREQDDEERQRRENEAILQTALGMNWSGAYNDYLNRLEAENQDINISNVFTPTNTFNPTNVNYQTQSQEQWQQQSQGGGQTQRQDQDDSDSDSTDNSGLLATLAAAGLTGAAVAGTTGGGTTSTGGTTTTKGGTTSTTTGGSKTGGGTSTVVDSGLTNLPGGSTTTDSQIIDFNLGTQDPGTVTDTVGGGTVYDTVTGGNGNDSIIGGDGNDTTVVTGPTQAEIEAARRKAADEQTVKGLYQNLFGRTDVDQEGLDYWTGQLASGKSSTDLLRDMVSGAQGADVQAAQNTDTVSKLYQDLLDRTPDAEGLSYFRSQLAAGASPDEVAQNIISGARAGNEASKISQAEYDRYFKQPEQTATNAPATTSLTAEQLAQFASANAGNSELVNSLQKFADDYYANNIMSANFSPDDFRSNFIYEAISQPDVLSKLVGESAASQFLTLGGGGEGDGSVGFDVNAIAREIAGSLDSEAFNELASSVGKLTDISSDVADFIGLGGDPVTGMITSLISGDSFAESAANVATTLLTNAAIDMSASALAALGIPGAGPFISAALVLDSVLSDALGYESPIQDGISWISTQIEKGVEWVGDVFGDIFGNIGDFFGGLFAEGGMVRYQEGGLVDLPSETSYNYADYYGGLSQMPQLSLDEVQPEMAFAGGGLIPLVGGGKIARGPGGGLDDLIPTSIDGRRAAALSDGEFVIPADVVSMMGDGSSNAGAKRLYDMVRQVRQVKTGTSKQAGPLPVGKILERTMK